MVEKVSSEGFCILTALKVLWAELGPELVEESMSESNNPKEEPSVQRRVSPAPLKKKLQTPPKLPRAFAKSTKLTFPLWPYTALSAIYLLPWGSMENPVGNTARPVSPVSLHEDLL